MTVPIVSSVRFSSGLCCSARPVIGVRNAHLLALQRLPSKYWLFSSIHHQTIIDVDGHHRQTASNDDDGLIMRIGRAGDTSECGLGGGGAARTSQMVADRTGGLGGQVEQPLDLHDGGWDQPEVDGWRLDRGVGCGWRFAAGSGLGDGHRAHCQGGHDEHNVPRDRGIQANLGLVETELVLAELVILLDGPAFSGHRDQHAQRGRETVGDVAVEVGQLVGFGQAAADQQEVPGAGGGQPGEGVPVVSFGPFTAGGDLPTVCEVRIFFAVASARIVVPDGSVTRNEQGTPMYGCPTCATRRP